MKKEKLVASALAFNTLLTAFTINVKAKTLDLDETIYESRKIGNAHYFEKILNYKKYDEHSDIHATFYDEH